MKHLSEYCMPYVRENIPGSIKVLNILPNIHIQSHSSSSALFSCQKQVLKSAHLVKVKSAFTTSIRPRCQVWDLKLDI